MTIALDVLGCGTPYPRPDDPCSGYLVQTADTNLWIDCGPGTFAALQRHIDLPDLSALWISHLHPDHAADLLSVFSWLANTPDAPQLTTYGPPGWANHLAAMLPMQDAHESVHRAFAVHELSDGYTAQCGDLELSALEMTHTVPTYGLRLQSGPTAIAYSADTAPCTALITLAAQADLFICEAGTEKPQPGHCTAQEAGQAASDAHAREQLIVHVPDRARRQRAANTAAVTATCPVKAAEPGMRIVLP